MNTSTTPAKIEPRPAGSALAVSTGQAFWSADQLAALAQIGVQNAPQGDLRVFLNFAQRTGLDPFARQIYMIGRNSKDRNGSWITKWTIQASIDGLRIVAERSGDYAGQTSAEYCGEDGVWRDTWTSKEPPVAARVGVLRHGFQAPAYGVAYYDEYAQTDRDGKPTQMWKDKPRLMLAKCAEALALRKAFPNDLSGLYTSDEMGAADRPPIAAPEPVSAPEPVVVVDEQTGEIIEVEEQASQAQLKAIHAISHKLGVERDAILPLLGRILKTDFASSAELSKSQAHQVIDTLKPLADCEDPVAAYDASEWFA